MKYKVISLITQEEFALYSMDRETLENLMVDEFDVYIHEGDEDYRIFYNTASDSFHYEKGSAIYEVEFTKE